MSAYIATPSKQNPLTLREARFKVQPIARRRASDFWLQFYSKIQIAADTDNMKRMYDGIKQAL